MKCQILYTIHVINIEKEVIIKKLYSEKSFRNLSEGILQGNLKKDVFKKTSGEGLHEGICRTKNKVCEPYYDSKENSLKNF